MDTFILENDISVFYVKAASFPDGVLAAHQKLHGLIPYSSERKYFGITNPDATGTILYRAAAEELSLDDANKLNLEKFVIKKGNYLSLIIHNYMNDIQSIGKAFGEMLSNPEIDSNGACIEWYLSDKDVLCMIRLQ